MRPRSRPVPPASLHWAYTGTPGGDHLHWLLVLLRLRALLGLGLGLRLRLLLRLLGRGAPSLELLDLGGKDFVLVAFLLEVLDRFEVFALVLCDDDAKLKKRTRRRKEGTR